MGLFELLLVAFVVMKLCGVAAVAGISWLMIFGAYLLAYAVLVVLFFLFGVIGWLVRGL